MNDDIKGTPLIHLKNHGLHGAFFVEYPSEDSDLLLLRPRWRNKAAIVAFRNGVKITSQFDAILLTSFLIAL